MKVEASPWSPWWTGKVERWNTLKEVLAKELKGESNEWDTLLPLVAFYFNCTVNLTTGVMLFELATGRLPTLPANVAMGQKVEKLTHNEYVTHTVDKMTRLSRAVYETTKQQQNFQQRQYNKRLHGEPLEVGDWVRVKYHGRPPAEITTKLLPRWRGPYRVAEKLGDMTYVVEMHYRGRVVSRVQNIRNLSKVKNIRSDGEEPEHFDVSRLWEDGEDSEGVQHETDSADEIGTSEPLRGAERQSADEIGETEPLRRAGRDTAVVNGETETKIQFGRIIKRPQRLDV